MFTSTFNISCLIFLLAVLRRIECLDYDDLIATGKYCPSRDKCEGYRSRLSYVDRNCECDKDCTSYNDCCIDAGGPRRRIPSGTRKSTRRNDICVPYGHKKYAGVYMVAECSSNWVGSDQVREKCVGPVDLSDPLNAAPLTNVQEKITYRNIFCAQCNNANMDSLKFHQLQFGCEGLQNLTQEQILDDLTYNKVNGMWGVNRRTSNGNKFIGCQILFNVPGYLNSSVRFCRPDVVSTCASDWTSPRIKKNCQEYMAVVYDKNNIPYKNPHCAMCNHISPESLFCTSSDMERVRPFSFTFLMDIHPGDGTRVGQKPVSTPVCPSNEIYDPFFKRCKRIICALDGYSVVNGECVKS